MKTKFANWCIKGLELKDVSYKKVACFNGKTYIEGITFEVLYNGTVPEKEFEDLKNKYAKASAKLTLTVQLSDVDTNEFSDIPKIEIINKYTKHPVHDRLFENIAKVINDLNSNQKKIIKKLEENDDEIRNK